MSKWTGAWKNWLAPNGGSFIVFLPDEIEPSAVMGKRMTLTEDSQRPEATETRSEVEFFRKIVFDICTRAPMGLPHLNDTDKQIRDTQRYTALVAAALFLKPMAESREDTDSGVIVPGDPKIATLVKQLEDAIRS